LYCPDFDNGMKTRFYRACLQVYLCCTARTLITG